MFTLTADGPEAAPPAPLVGAAVDLPVKVAAVGVTAGAVEDEDEGELAPPSGRRTRGCSRSSSKPSVCSQRSWLWPGARPTFCTSGTFRSDRARRHSS